MDSKNIFSRSLVLMLCLCITSMISQLTNTDINYIKKFIISQQEESNGIFGKSYDNTYKAIFSLKLLNEPVPLIPKICREISFEAMNEITMQLMDINELLNCKINFEHQHAGTDFDIKLNSDLETIFKRVNMAVKLQLQAKINWEILFENLKAFITPEKLFSNINGSGRQSLISTAHGLKLLTLINENVGEKYKEEVRKEIILIFTNIQSEFQLLRDDIGIFTENKVSSIILNSLFADTITSVNSILEIENYEETVTKLLNYFVNFKYGFTDLENIFYLLKGIDTLSNIPIVVNDKLVYDYLEDKSITLKLVDGLGKEINIYNSTFLYRLINKPEFELEHEQTSEYLTAISEKGSSINLDVSSLITKPGSYNLAIKANYEKNKKNFEHNFTITVTSITRIKLNHLKMAVTNTNDKTDEKEITVEHPKRTFKNMKATQNSILKLKVKLNYGSSQIYKIEQMFLRLRHTELGKSYSAYVVEYKSTDDYFYINLDMSDPSQMEAYDGVYELTLVVSDPGFDNPMIWNFGKLEVKFRKPLDPSITPSFKNKNKEKMEPYFPPEQSPNQHIIPSLIFSFLVFTAFLMFIYYLRVQKANMKQFPKPGDKLNFIFSIAFVIFLFLVTYIMILFYVKLNIIQTLIAFLAIGTPGVIIVYNVLANIYIEV